MISDGYLSLMGYLISNLNVIKLTHIVGFVIRIPSQWDGGIFGIISVSAHLNTKYADYFSVLGQVCRTQDPLVHMCCSKGISYMEMFVRQYVQSIHFLIWLESVWILNVKSRNLTNFNWHSLVLNYARIFCSINLKYKILSVKCLHPYFVMENY